MSAIDDKAFRDSLCCQLLQMFRNAHRVNTKDEWMRVMDAKVHLAQMGMGEAAESVTERIRQEFKIGGH